MRAAVERGELVLRSGVRFDGMKVFSATTPEEGAALAARATAWIEDQTELEIVDITVVQSSTTIECIVITWRALR
jgi:hypothetical protein